MSILYDVGTGDCRRKGRMPKDMEDAQTFYPGGMMNNDTTVIDRWSAAIF